MTQEELDSQLAASIRELRTLGVPISREIRPGLVVNTRAQRRLGCCVYRDGAFTIEVSARILEDSQLFKVTLLHELLHTCYGCQNHGKRWKSCAQKVGRPWEWRSPARCNWKASRNGCAKRRSSTCSSAKAAAG